MDPRPYHYDYRRPRVHNPTYLSKELFNRIQQQPRNSSPPNQIPPNPELKRANSTDFSSSKGSQLESLRPGYSRSSIPSSQKLSSSMANYGRNLMQNSRYEQEDVFKRQERRFNIISYWPKSVEPKLKENPRLTLEDKLFQIGIPNK